MTIVSLIDPPDINEIYQWVNHNFDHVIPSKMTEMSDVSVYIDEIYEFYFENEKEAEWFILRWK
jgi:hypothetical protein